MGNKIKYIGLFILVIAIIAGGTIFIFRGRIITHYIPTIKQIGDIHIKVKNDTSFISSKLIIKNNSFINIKIDSIKYQITLLNKTYLQSQKFIGVVLPNYSSDTLNFILKIPYKSILKNLRAMRKKGDSISYSINISFQYSTIFGKAEMPINKSAKLIIPQQPEIEIIEIKYKKIRLKYLLADVRIKIINYSPVTLLIKDISYSMRIINQGHLKGKFNEPINIKPKGTTFIKLPLEINVKNLGKTIFDVLINKDNYNYSLTMNAILESTSPLKQSFHIDLTKNGMMELIK